MRKRSWSPVHWAILAAVVVFCAVAVSLAVHQGAGRQENTRLEQQAQAAYRAARQEIQSRLLAPDGAKFPDFREVTVSRAADRWTVKGYVDASDSFATTRTYWSVKLVRADDGFQTLDISIR